MTSAASYADPDERVVEAVRLIFRKFLELGSARQVLLWARTADLTWPVLRQGPRGSRIAWRPPAYHTVRQIIDRLKSDPAFWMARGKRKTMIVVEVDEGYVTLSGFVRSSAEKRLADILARALGALGVDNRLQLEGEVEGRWS